MKKYDLPIILDIEASGLEDNISYPIEVAYILPDGTIDSYLIKPEKKWTHWCGHAAKVHNIPRELIVNEGIPAWEVATRLNAQLTGEYVYTDCARMDEMWLKKMYNDLGIDMEFDIIDLRMLFEMNQGRYFFNCKREIEKGKQAHRAHVDVEIIRDAFVDSRIKAHNRTERDKLRGFIRGILNTMEDQDFNKVYDRMNEIGTMECVDIKLTKKQIKSIFMEIVD